jgi:iron-sulfur cluster assembly accessory protein
MGSMSSSVEKLQITQSIHISQPALEQVRKLIEEQELKGLSLRLFISQGGCSGFQYGMGLDENIQENDHHFAFDDINVVVDPVSMNYLTGATIEYDDDLMGGGFRIENPNAVSSCGCGNSFRTANGGEESAGSCY